MRDDLGLSFSDEELEDYPFIDPSKVPEEVEHLKEERPWGILSREALSFERIDSPGSEGYSTFDEGTMETCRFPPLWHS